MPRKEDRRMLLGRGRFTADLNPTTRTPGLQGAGLADMGVSFDHIPVLPQDISAALARTGGAP
jgi:hypothetical protein